MKLFILCTLWLLAISVRSDNLPKREELSKLPFETRMEEALKYIEKNATLKTAYQEHLKAYEVQKPLLHASSAAKFPCDLSRSLSTPTSVHRLRPGDIDVVAGLGDSITGGNGILAKNIFGVLTQWRGYSWSIGGDETWKSVPTIANFLKSGNPKLVGYSLGKGDKENPNAYLNVAKAGATADNIPIQARNVVDKMKTLPGVDFENDWKLVTIFIGGNDICDCDLGQHNPDTYAAKIREGLDILYNEVPRVFVNLVEVLDVSLLADLSSGLICDALHVFECPCGAFPITDHRYEQMKITTRAFQDKTQEIVSSGYDMREDFTIVRQPFFRNTAAPRLPSGAADFSYFAPDCFHLSEKGHAGAAEALWNNMMEPVGSKRTEWRLGEPLECPPSNFPYLSTARNSEERKNLRTGGNLLSVNSVHQPGLLGAQNAGAQAQNVKAKNVGAHNVNNVNAQNVGAQAQNVKAKNVGAQNVNNVNAQNVDAPAQNVKAQNVGAQNVNAQNVGAQNVLSALASNNAVENPVVYGDIPPPEKSGVSTTTIIIIACTVSLFVGILISYFAGKKFRRAKKHDYEAMPEMVPLVS